MKKRRLKMPVRLNAKPTRPHSGKRGARGYRRREAKALLRRQLKQAEQ